MEPDQDASPSIVTDRTFLADGPGGKTPAADVPERTPDPYRRRRGRPRTGEVSVRLRLGTRTIGAAYLVAGAGSGAGAALGGGAVAAVWGVTCGAMGVAWLARTDAVVQPDRIRLPRRGFGHRDLLFVDVARIAVPHAWALDATPRAELHDGTRVPLRGLTPDDLRALATAAGVALVTDPAPPRSAAGVSGEERR